MQQRVCDYLTTVIEDLIEHGGLKVENENALSHRLKDFWAEYGEVLYVIAVQT